VEALSVSDRYKKAILAGVDRLGGDITPDIVVELVKSGGLTEARVDESARRILRVFFALGLFENPYVSPERRRHGAPGRVPAEGGPRAAQVDRAPEERGAVLPLKKGARMYVEDVDVAVAARTATCRPPAPRTRTSASSASSPPDERRPASAPGAAPIDLTLPAQTLDHVLAIARKRPTVVALHLHNRSCPRAGPGVGGAPRHLRRERRGALRRPQRPVRADRQAAVRDAVVDGRRPRAARGRAHDSKDPLFPIGSG